VLILEHIQRRSQGWLRLLMDVVASTLMSLTQ